MNLKIIGLVAGVALLVFVLFIGFKYSENGFTKNIGKFVCDLRGGDMRPINCNMDAGTCSFTCLVASKDVGKPCTNSNQCSRGVCLVKSPNVPVPVESRSAPELSACTHTRIDSYECPSTVIFQAVCADATESQNCFGFWKLVGNNQIILSTGTCPNVL